MKNIFFVILAIFQFCSIVYAQEISTIRNISPIQIKVVHRGLGNAQINFTSEKVFDLLSTDTTKFYQGHVTIRNKTLPAGGVKQNGKWTITFPGRIHGSRQTRQRLYTVKKSNSTIKVSGVPSSSLSEHFCGGDHEVDSDSREHIIKENLVSALTLPTVKILTISTFADVEWYQKYKQNSNVEIAKIINAAEAIYHAQLGIRFRLVSQNIFTNTTPELDSIEILNAFRLRPETKTAAAIKHLFTGKDMIGKTIGIAYVGATCYAPDWSYGVTQSYNSLSANIFAHEIGHNLGAQHDVYNYGSLMYPSVSFGDVLFSQYSLDQINSQLRNFGTCLEYETETPTIGIKKKKAQISIILQAGQTPITNELITYRINSGKKVTRRTSRTGSVSITIKKRGRYKIVAHLASNPKIIAKATLKF